MSVESSDETEARDLTEDAGDPAQNPSSSVRFMCFLLGNASLLTCNMTLNALDVLNAYARRDVAFDLNRAYNIPVSVMSLFLCFVRPSNLRVAPLLVLGLATADQIVFPVLFYSGLSPDSMHVATIATVAAAALCGSLVFSCSFSLASQFGPLAGAAVSSGNGCSGCIAAAMRVATKAAGGRGEIRLSATIYFGVAIAIM